MRAVARAVVLLFLGVSAGWSGAGEPVPPALWLDGVEWDVDVFGAVARGTVVERWTNTADEAVETKFSCASPPAASRCAVRIDTADGEPGRVLHGDLVQEATPEPRARRSVRTAKVDRRGGVGTTAVSVTPGASVTVRSEFDAPLSYAGGEFLLHLPATSRGTAPPAPVTWRWR